MARLGRSDPRGDAPRIPVRLSQSQPLARSLRPYRDRLARLPRRARRGRAGRSGDRLGNRAAVAAVRRHRRIRPRDLSRVARLRPRGAADPDLVPAGDLGACRRPRGARLGDERHRRPGAARRAGADRHADRLHGDAARLRRRRHPRHRLRRRAAGVGADRRRRPDLGLGRRRRQRVHQRRDRDRARPQARHAGGPRVAMARGAPSARPRSLPRLARQRARAAPRPAGAGLPPARSRRALSLVHHEGAAGRRLGRRGGPPRRHVDRRHRRQGVGGAPASRCGARPSHRAAEPRAVPRSPRSRARLRQGQYRHPADGDGDRPRPLQAGQRFRRHGGRRLRSC